MFDRPILANIEIERRQQRLIGDHQAGEQDEEDDLLARHGEAREAVAGRHGQHQAEDDRQDGHQQAVEEIGPEARLKVDDVQIVLEAERMRQIGRRNGLASAGVLIEASNDMTTGTASRR